LKAIIEADEYRAIEVIIVDFYDNSDSTSVGGTRTHQNKHFVAWFLNHVACPHSKFHSDAESNTRRVMNAHSTKAETLAWREFQARGTPGMSTCVSMIAVGS
jgi:hypothetical protein